MADVPQKPSRGHCGDGLAKIIALTMLQPPSLGWPAF
jgi:hypothetical protein